MRREPVPDRLQDSHAAVLAAITEGVRVVESNPLPRSITVQSQLLRDLRVGVQRVDEQKICFVNRRNIERACVREFPIDSRVRCESVIHAMWIIQIVTSQRRVFILLKRVQKSYGAAITICREAEGPQGPMPDKTGAFEFSDPSFNIVFPGE